jgi:hypothetical protein
MTCGDVAQLGERGVRNAEVEGSIPFISILYDLKDLKEIYSSPSLVFYNPIYKPLILRCPKAQLVEKMLTREKVMIKIRYLQHNNRND